MAMGHERSKPLHNFNLPCGLKWGSQRFLRCSKVDPAGHRRSSNGPVIKFRPPSSGGDGIAAVREKLMFDLQAEADKMKNAILREGLEDNQNQTPVVAGDGSRPWNLRARRAACKAPAPPPPPPPQPAAANGGDGSPPLRLRSGVGAGAGAGDCSGAGGGEKRERAKFSVSLNRREIEEDFIAMVSHRPPRRPKKRAKLVQKNLDTLFPGLWLTEITPDLYKVPDDQ